jgi:hypothetical protein
MTRERKKPDSRTSAGVDPAERRQQMYYCVAIQQDPPSPWQWISTVLSSQQAMCYWLRLRQALPEFDRLRVFSSLSREGLEEQLTQENEGLPSHSVTAAHFLQKGPIPSPEEIRGTPAHDEGVERRWQPSLMGAIAARSHPAVKENDTEGDGVLAGIGMSALERRRLEQEYGAGGDHDVPYHFALPLSMPQVLAWTMLLGRVQRGELEP